MAEVMYLQPIATSSSSFSSSATVRRRDTSQKSYESLWSSFLVTNSDATQTRRVSSAGRSSSLKPVVTTTASTDSPKESFKSAYSRQCPLPSPPQCPPSATKIVHMQRGLSLTDELHYSQIASDQHKASESRSHHESIDEQDDIGQEIEDAAHSEDKTRTFRRWMSTLRRRKQPPLHTVSPTIQRWQLDDFDQNVTTGSCFPARRSHEKSDSYTSSSGLIATMKSATMTIASASIAPFSRQGSNRRQGHIHSSLISASDPRPSFDSQRQMLDGAARQRSRKRRDKLEELIRSEESYVADLKALCNAYFTLLGHQQTFASFARKTAQSTIYDMLHLHDDLLGQLQRIIPFAEFDQSTAKASKPARRGPHARWHSVDGIPKRVQQQSTNIAAARQGRRSLSISKSIEQEPIVLHCPPYVVGAVATVFCAYIPRFAVYDAFGAKFEMIRRDIEQTQGLIASWPDFDRAIEALSTALNPIRSRDANRCKALTIKDLLIKPIQRLPRYELLFAELSRLTPVCDDPVAHALIEDLRCQLAEKRHGYWVNVFHSRIKYRRESSCIYSEKLCSVDVYTLHTEARATS